MIDCMLGPCGRVQRETDLPVGVSDNVKVVVERCGEADSQKRLHNHAG